MYKLILPAAALAAFMFVNTSADSAKAQGFHFSNGRVHVDVGNPHGFHRGHGHHRGHHRVHRGHRKHGGWGRSHVWHDTSHWDYHPTEIRRHGNHWHVYPGHYDWHQTGHLHHLHP